MADELYDSDARAQKAYRRVISAARKLAKQVGNNELGDEVANASHQDASTREMRRYEALASLLEALAGGPEGAPPESKPAAKTDKGE